jgi:hypothetical protein
MGDSQGADQALATARSMNTESQCGLDACRKANSDRAHGGPNLRLLSPLSEPLGGRCQAAGMFALQAAG